MKPTKKHIQQCLITAGCAASLLALTGCVAAPLALAALGGYTVVKATDSKSKVKTTFGKPNIENTNALLSIQSMAIWPKANGQMSPISDVSLAEELSQSNVLKVITPMIVMRILESNSLPHSVEEMTGNERLQVFKTVADKTDADAVFFSSLSDTKADYGGFAGGMGLKSATATETVMLVIYSRQKNDVIWQDDMSVVRTSGAKSDGAAEAQHQCTAQLAKRILEITGKNASPVPNQTVTSAQ